MDTPDDRADRPVPERNDRPDPSGGTGPHTRNDVSGTTRDTVQAGTVSGGVHFHRHGSADDEAGSPMPRQLPADVHDFVNRTEQLAQLSAVLPDGDGDPLALSVAVIAGTAGAGKTSLALHWAHQVKHRFPDGQLYANLRGYDPGEPVTAHQALHGFLTALGVQPTAVPQDTDAAAALYRSLLADRRVLVVLDNAGSAAQVRPLLPGAPASLTLVTSRSRLSGLAIRDGARRLTLGTLPEPEAVALLRTITADYRPADDAEKLVELARLCARLPLALRIAAERAAANPHLRLDDLIADLRDQSALWDVLSTSDGDGEDAEAIRTVFAWSYRALPPPAARLFRLLGLHPAPDIGLHTAAALTALPVPRTRQLLDVLVGAHLLEQTAPDRYEFHDLLRAYATEQAQHEEPDAEREMALGRVRDWYLHSAAAAQRWIEPDEDPVPLDEPAEGVVPLAFADYDEAVDFAEREHTSQLAVLHSAAAAGAHRYTWQLAAVLFNAMPPTAPATDWLAVTETGTEAARHADPAVRARMLEYLGMSHTQLNAYEQGRACHLRALDIHNRQGDRRGAANSLNLIGLTHLHQRELDAAEGLFKQAHAAFTALGLAQEADLARMNLASVQYDAGRLDEAARATAQVLDFRRAQDDRSGAADALALLSQIHTDQGATEVALREATDAVNTALDLRDHILEGYWLLALGDAQRALGKHGDALISYQRSAILHRRLGNRFREAVAWYGTGLAYAALDRPEEAAAFLARARETFRMVGDRWYEALALAGLAAALCETAALSDTAGDAAPAGAHEEAARHRAAALRLVADYDDPRAAALRARLTAAGD
ncbi:ATP-binding protein [Streptomyces odontomachi]|uniref:ATP-binding protein n=1 Tax=Streptomyces odontomachi TaxID=2944940 RepID=UPI00210AC522|nr:tetratricopeptide repeat protein [Streptomyces sp. ODS25]